MIRHRDNEETEQDKAELKEIRLTRYRKARLQRDEAMRRREAQEEAERRQRESPPNLPPLQLNEEGVQGAPQLKTQTRLPGRSKDGRCRFLESNGVLDASFADLLRLADQEDAQGPAIRTFW